MYPEGSRIWLEDESSRALAVGACAFLQKLQQTRESPVHRFDRTRSSCQKMEVEA